MKNSFYVLTVFVLSLFTACNKEDLCLIGSGKVENYELSTDPFDEISIIGPVNLRIQQGQTLSLNVDAEPEMFAELSYAVKNGLLEIGFDNNVSCFETEHGVWINVTLPNLAAVYQSGLSEIISDGDLLLSRLELSISGTADIALSGQVEEHFITSSGLINAQNFNFISKNTSVDISGTADLELSCSDQLDIEVDGSARIAYKGNPSISQKVSGELDLIDAN